MKNLESKEQTNRSVIFLEHEDLWVIMGVFFFCICTSIDREFSYLILITITWENTNTDNSFGYISIFKQSTLLLDAFNKDRASLPQPLPNPPPLAPLPVITPDARTQEMINEKLKKAEDLGKSVMLSSVRSYLILLIFTLVLFHVYVCVHTLIIFVKRLINI